MAKTPSPSAPTPFETELAAFFGEAGASAPLRDHVSFRAADGAADPMAAVGDLVRHVRATAKTRPDRVRLRPHQSHSGAVSVRVYREGDRFHTIKFALAPDGRLYARHNVAGGRALSLMLHDWLSATDRFTDIAWRTRNAFAAGEPGHPRPE